MRVRELALLALCPPVAFWLLHFAPIAQNGFLDPFIYTGYINNFEDLFQRYGVTYYGVRFGLVAPAELASAVFGPVAGYGALRYAFALLASVPFYVLVRQRFARPTALASVFLLLTSPYLARTILWDHPDASGVPFLFAAICLILIEHPRRWILDAVAGICAGLAIQSNIFAAAPFGVVLVVWSMLWLFWRRGIGALFSRLLILAICVGIVAAVASWYYQWRVNVDDIFSVTINKSVELINGGMVQWRTPGIAWVASQWHVLTPVVLAVAALIAGGRRPLAFQDAVMWATATAVTVFFYVVQFAANGNSLELFYYFSYLLPFVFLLLALIVGHVFSDAQPGTNRRGFLLLVVTAIGPWIAHALGSPVAVPARVTTYLIVVTACAGTLVLWRSVPRARSSTTPAVAAALGLTLFSSFSTPVYARMIEVRERSGAREIDVYRVATQLIQHVPRWSEQPGAVGFWYSNDPARYAVGSVQSTYLWSYSRLQVDDGPGMPSLTAADLKRLQRFEMKRLILLAETPGDIAAGREALTKSDIRHALIARRVLTSKTFTLYFELVELGAAGHP